MIHSWLNRLRLARMLDRTVQAVKDRNRDIPAEMLEAMIDEAVREVRSQAENKAR